MARPELSKEDFLRMAQMVGLDTKDPHMEELYPYVKSVLKSLEPLDEIDVGDVEPYLVFIPPQE